ncbi:SecY-interacting protein Syd [Clostridium sp. DJ247]|uniref:SecY-interacting protein Syd n=1 Tax=Clostridium sp. DJ247 TaxID=2726188 RepID=UPI00162341AC|nr:SecY-interacting protein Syd [Clostridium sp. DJ247]MBC2582755.1 hypothetical protein [Clostridium sp. DJ247]
MSVRTAMKKFFDDMLEAYSKTEEKFPISPKIEEEDLLVYVGKNDKDGWIRWKPVKREKNAPGEEKVGMYIEEPIYTYTNFQEEPFITYKWKPVEKHKIHDFKDIEDEFKVKIHDDVKEFFNSYWFIEINALGEDYDVRLDGIVPNLELEQFRETLREYADEHNGELKYTPLGIEDNGEIVVVENETGNVKFEDYDAERYIIVADNLEEFILKSKPEVIDKTGVRVW